MKSSRFRRTTQIWLLWWACFFTLCGAFAFDSREDGLFRFWCGLGGLVAGGLLVYEFKGLRRQNAELGYQPVFTTVLLGLSVPALIVSLIPAVLLSHSVLAGVVPERWELLANWILACLFTLPLAHWAGSPKSYPQFLDQEAPRSPTSEEPPQL